MLINRKSLHQPTEQDVTPESVYQDRRTILKALGLSAASMSFPFSISTQAAEKVQTVPKALSAKSAISSNDLVLTPESKVTTYNNFYEFGVNKADPAKNSAHFKAEPWTLRIEGLVTKPQTIDVWSLINNGALEERIYRMRCVEAWSMVIPWLGIELNKLISLAEPTSDAKYVVFETLYDQKQFPDQASIAGALNYPYVEGLRLDEAMHPLTLMAVGLYGKTLPAQNGAPIRLVVPWKYGFKSIKSIVSIKLVAQMPTTTWHQLAPNEYGFFANVNPKVDHPRWSQASERFIGNGGLFGAKRQPTRPFNGYQDEVASLYNGMDLTKWF